MSARSTISSSRVSLKTPTWVVKHSENAAKVIEKLLQPVHHLELEETDSDNSSISDQFENLHKDSYFLSQLMLKNSEIDKLTMEKFSDNYKTTIKEVRGELQVRSF